MNPPLFSTFTLLTELLVTSAIFYVFYQGFTYNKFPFKVALLALCYEVLFNISYMSYRAYAHESSSETHIHTAFHTGVAIFHGVFSLVMFVALLVFLGFAIRAYKNGENYFKKHSILTVVFLLFWSVAVLSGVVFYYLAYFTES